MMPRISIVRYDYRVAPVRLSGLIAHTPRVTVLPPAGHTPRSAAALTIPETCPPALLSVLADIVRRVSLERCGTLIDDQTGLSF